MSAESRPSLHVVSPVHKQESSGSPVLDHMVARVEYNITVTDKIDRKVGQAHGRLDRVERVLHAALWLVGLNLVVSVVSVVAEVFW